jgi:hypothetical protein
MQPARLVLSDANFLRWTSRPITSTSSAEALEAAGEFNARYWSSRPYFLDRIVDRTLEDGAVETEAGTVTI